MNKLLDLRFVIGLFFVILALLLIGKSFFSEGQGEFVNRASGFVFGIFGALMIVLSLEKNAHDEL